MLWIFVFAKNIGKNIGENISKNIRSENGQKLLDHAKQLATNTLKAASKEATQKQQKQLVI